MNMSDITEQMRENVYYRPTIPNFKSVESFVIVKKNLLFKGERGLCIVAFQATVAKTHELSRSGLKDIQEKVKTGFGPQMDLYVVFVTKARDGISERQELGSVTQALDVKYLQFVLNGMELEDVMLKVSVTDDAEGAECAEVSKVE